LLETLDAGGQHGRSLAELGIGTNPAATLTGNVLEDEKVIGTIHLAFGTSAGMGGVNIAGVHASATSLGGSSPCRDNVGNRSSVTACARGFAAAASDSAIICCSSL
jgi:leucyl aminopeptidase (aminopeptidase T)